jgi:hypothetical protein
MNAAKNEKGILRPHWMALLVALIFVIVQAFTLDYGTRINDLPHIRNYQVPAGITQQSGLERNTLIGTRTDRTESVPLWMARYKLYTVDADEVYSIIALARIRPGQLQFDPHYYQYGGAFLYPLGVYYFALSKLGVISIGSLEQMLANPQQINRVWIAGRAFVLLAAALAGLALYLALATAATPAVALIGLAIFYACPATVMFSQVLKPHWYALLFSNIALLIMTRAAAAGTLTRGAEIALGIAIGLAVGSVITFGLFAVMLWYALLYLVWRRSAPIESLLLVPIIAVIVFLATNPYYLLDWQAVQTERAATAGWYTFAVLWDAAPNLLRYTVLPGFGIALTLVFFAVVIRHLIRPAPLGLRLFGLAVLVPLAVMAAITAKLYFWHSNFRYFPYALPSMILFLGAAPWPYRRQILALAVVVTIVQTAPLKLAYIDENSREHSTRLVAAAWIDAHVPVEESVCSETGTPAPYSMPPFRFDLHRLNAPDCRWLVVVDGNREPRPATPGWTLAHEFRPRLSPDLFPLVWEHVNPRVAVFRKTS